MTGPAITRSAQLAAATIVLFLVTGCGSSGRSGDSGDTGDRFVRPGSPHASPSGDYLAEVTEGPSQNGVDTWLVVIKDAAAGTEVFRDGYAYSTRHRVAVTWLSDRDQLWILSADVGTSYVQARDGTWVKTAITPETRDTIPEEIEKLR